MSAAPAPRSAVAAAAASIPSTGLYEPGVNWTTTANADGTVTPVKTAVPVTDPSTWIYTRNNGLVDLDYLEAHIKNDYAAKFDTDLFSSTTIAGFAGNSSKVHYKSWVPAARPRCAREQSRLDHLSRLRFPPITPGSYTSAQSRQQPHRSAKRSPDFRL
jgi:iron complex outermembrane receptor protein